MTSSKIFKRGSFCEEQRYRRMVDQKPGLALNQDFAKELDTLPPAIIGWAS